MDIDIYVSNEDIFDNLYSVEEILKESYSNNREKEKSSTQSGRKINNNRKLVESVTKDSLIKSPIITAALVSQSLLLKSDALIAANHKLSQNIKRGKRTYPKTERKVTIIITHRSK